MKEEGAIKQEKCEEKQMNEASQQKVLLIVYSS